MQSKADKRFVCTTILGLRMVLIKKAFKTYFVWLSAVLPDSVTHQLSCQKRHVLYDGEANSPLCILCQLHNGGQQ